MSNRPQLALLWSGGIGIVVGGIIALVAHGTAANQSEIDALTGSMVGYGIHSAALDAANGWMWFGIVLAILGVIALIAGGIVSALRPQTEDSPAASK